MPRFTKEKVDYVIKEMVKNEYEGHGSLTLKIAAKVGKPVGKVARLLTEYRKLFFYECFTHAEMTKVVRKKLYHR